MNHFRQRTSQSVPALSLLMLVAACTDDAGSLPRGDAGVDGSTEPDEARDADQEGEDADGGDAERDAPEADAHTQPVCTPTCAEDEYCLPTGVCAPRCSDECGEPGPLVDADAGELAGPLASDGTTLFYFTRSWSRSDVSTDPYEFMYSWDLTGTPSVLKRDGTETRQLSFQDGRLYHLSAHPDFPPILSILGLNGQVERDFYDDNVRHFWLRDHSVYWSGQHRTTLDDAVFRLDTAMANGPAELVAAGTQGPDGVWRAGNGTRVFKSDTYKGCRILQGALDDALAVSSVGSCSSAADILFADDDALFISVYASGDSLYGHYGPRPASAGGIIQRIALDGSDEVLSLTPSDLKAVNAFQVGDWIYWGAYLDEVTGSIHRSHREMALPSEELLRGDLDPAVFTVMGDSLVWSRRDRWFVKPLLALPCSDTVPCAGGGTCSVQRRCE
jgi:hypothetical protein